MILPVRQPEPYLNILCKKISQTLSLAEIPYELLVQEEPGLTTAVVQGVKKSRFQNIVVMDADGSHNPKYLVSMYKLLNDYDVVIGYKAKDESPHLRRLISFIYRMIAKLLLDLDLIDPMSGFVMGQKNI